MKNPHPVEATTNWINAGTYVLEPEVLRYIPANSHYMFEKGLFPTLLEQGEPVYGYPFNGYWLDMGNPGKYLSLNCDLLLSKTSSPIIHVPEDGICCEAGCYYPSFRHDSGAGHYRHTDATISRGVHVKGPVVIGPDCRIEEGAAIENAVLWNNVHIGANARLSQCIIGSNTSIEPDSQISNCVVTSSHTVKLDQ